MGERALVGLDAGRRGWRRAAQNHTLNATLGSSSRGLAAPITRTCTPESPMTSLAEVLLVIHIAAGFAALVAGAGAMVTRKGQRYHLRSERIYFWGMAVVTATALPLAILRSNIFLFAVAILSFYLAFTGYRVVVRRRAGALGRPAALDWAGTWTVLLASAGLLVYGGWARGGDVTALVFGGVAGLLGVRDLLVLRRSAGAGGAAASGEWWAAHMRSMLGAYIATFTAFAVTNAVFLPAPVRWLAPTVVGSIGIAVWVARYRRAGVWS